MFQRQMSWPGSYPVIYQVIFYGDPPMTLGGTSKECLKRLSAKRITICNMKTSISARVDEALVAYLDSYQKEHAIKSRSEALEQAIKALRERNLGREYALAMAEWDASGEGELWDRTAGDGLEHAKDAHEAW